MNKSQENLYAQLADNCAIRALRQQDHLNRLALRTQELTTKYATVLNWSAARKIVYLLAVPAHFSAAVLAGLSIVPMLLSYEFGPEQSLSTSALLLGGIPIVMMFFLSLALGQQLSSIHFHWDPIVPRKPRYSIPNLLGSLVVLLLYTGLITHLIQMGVAKTEQSFHARVTLIGWLSLAELIIGYFAHKGWNVAYVHFQHWRLARAHVRAQQHYYKAEQRCQRYHEYYRQLNTTEEAHYMLPHTAKLLLQTQE